MDATILHYNMTSLQFRTGIKRIYIAQSISIVFQDWSNICYCLVTGLNFLCVNIFYCSVTGFIFCLLRSDRQT